MKIEYVPPDRVLIELTLADDDVVLDPTSDSPIAGLQACLRIAIHFIFGSILPLLTPGQKYDIMSLGGIE
jgi:hypothetical protein